MVKHSRSNLLLLLCLLFLKTIGADFCYVTTFSKLLQAPSKINNNVSAMYSGSILECIVCVCVCVGGGGLWATSDSRTSDAETGDPRISNSRNGLLRISLTSPYPTTVTRVSLDSQIELICHVLIQISICASCSLGHFNDYHATKKKSAAPYFKQNKF